MRWKIQMWTLRRGWTWVEEPFGYGTIGLKVDYDSLVEAQAACAVIWGSGWLNRLAKLRIMVRHGSDVCYVVLDSEADVALRRFGRGESYGQKS